MNSQFAYDKKHPIILSSKHPFTKSLFINEHERLLHSGPKQTLNSIRDQFWPIGGQNLSKQTVRQCITCFKAYPKSIQNLLGHLPLDRVKAHPPFTVVGTDYCGPFVIKDRKGRGSNLSKCYVCLFVCFSTKAIHLEPVTDLSSEAFILCLRRFASSRGMPSKFYLTMVEHIVVLSPNL
ncbi:hypothetical protein NQ317_016313 [Molorchus minor]|uniref:Integrase zinc-binding domain-containing protein n=1 Tax=Molorchus minor TaxID=1323400 RepID=A0ABQ9K5B9_9CUCU|nr:hypothetical protein NQ317_016313 [Molorchus minor]